MGLLYIGLAKKLIWVLPYSVWKNPNKLFSQPHSQVEASREQSPDPPGPHRQQLTRQQRSEVTTWLAPHQTLAQAAHQILGVSWGGLQTRKPRLVDKSLGLNPEATLTPKQHSPWPSTCPPSPAASQQHWQLTCLPILSGESLHPGLETSR